MDKERHLFGVIADGDIRKFVAEEKFFLNEKVENLMTKNSITIKAEAQAYEALNIIAQKEITVLPVVTSDNKIDGILHLHNILGKGNFSFE